MSKEIDKKNNNKISVSSRERIIEFENALISAADGINIEGNGKRVMTESKIAPIKHTFADGVYIRQMDMAAGTIVVGAIHKHLHMCFLLSGLLTVADENGTKDYIAPCYIISTPGTKRVLYAHEDSVWYNTHKNPSNTKDIRKIEEELVAINYKEYEQYINKNK